MATISAQLLFLHAILLLPMLSGSASPKHKSTVHVISNPGSDEKVMRYVETLLWYLNSKSQKELEFCWVINAFEAYYTERGPRFVLISMAAKLKERNSPIILFEGSVEEIYEPGEGFAIYDVDYSVKSEGGGVRPAGNRRCMN